MTILELTPMAADLHADGAQIAVALTGSVLIAAPCAPLVGRPLDVHGGRGLMTTGPIIGTLAVLAWSRVETLPQLYAVFAVIGIACATVLVTHLVHLGRSPVLAATLAGLPGILRRYGAGAYASLSGRVAAFSVAGKAVAPLGAITLAQATGYTWVMTAVAVACAVAALALVAHHRV
ncbi:hypothetical protein [Streptosporangium sp. NPDC023615]|uniref:hypothetical protein n=1 Tax=Streptosporangium sp. NPDC023615 TaxID=3154794 RepID=UPI003445380F